MQAAVGISARLPLAGRVRADLPSIGAWSLGFSLVVYLALKGGGYDTIVRSQVGIAVWWLVLLAALVGIVADAPIGRRGWIAIALLALFAGWTALTAGWSDSGGRGATELGRNATYVGVLMLALLARGRAGARPIVSGLACAIALVAALALLSRLHPQWFPANDTASLLPSTRSRLNYPLNYWNALAALVALGLPLVLGVASSARTLAGRALAAAALPAMALTLFFTFSRGGAVAAGTGLLVFLLLVPDRLPKVRSLALGGAGGAILIVAATQRDALESGLGNAAARQQGDDLLAMTLAVCAGVALVQLGLSLAARHGARPRFLTVAPSTAARALTVGLVALALGAVGAGAPGWLSDRWDQFKNPQLGLPTGKRNTVARFDSASGNGRYQYWQSSSDAESTHPWRGIGPGGFETWWARHGKLGGFVRDAHSLYVETFGELGLVGFALIAGFFLWVLAVGVAQALRAPPTKRLPFAAATAGCAAFSVSAGVDWVWEVAVLPVAFLVLVAAAVGSRAGHRHLELARRYPAPVRIGVAAASLGALVAIAIPLAGASAIRDSQAEAAGRLGPALEWARTAERIQPGASAPKLQQGLLLERAGDLPGAARALRAATAADPTDWRLWLTLSRVEAEQGRAAASVSAYRTARSLNPRSVLFQ